MEKFITVLSYAFGGYATIIIVLKIWFQVSYNEIDALSDAMRGIRRTWNYGNEILILIGCLCWIISQHI